MTRKRRVNSLKETRNGMPCYTPGDKHYRHPEYLPGFFKEGGLITGCTFQRGSHAPTVARNTTGWKEFEAEHISDVQALTKFAVARRDRKETIPGQPQFTEIVWNVDALVRELDVTVENE